MKKKTLIEKTKTKNLQDMTLSGRYLSTMYFRKSKKTIRRSASSCSVKHDIKCINDYQDLEIFKKATSKLTHVSVNRKKRN